MSDPNPSKGYLGPRHYKNLLHGLNRNKSYERYLDPRRETGQVGAKDSMKTSNPSPHSGALASRCALDQRMVVGTSVHTSVSTNSPLG